MRREGPLQITRMIAHPELALDQSRNAFQGPTLGGKACRCRAPVKEATQPNPVASRKPGRPSCPRPSLQSAPALLMESCCPPRDTGAAHPKLPGDLRLGEPLLPQQRRCRQTALFHLLRRQMGRPPNVAIHRAHLTMIDTALCYTCSVKIISTSILNWRSGL
jgi:hypothetical protein